MKKHSARLAMIGVVLAGVCAAGQARAQGARTHDGFYMRLGANLGPMWDTESYDASGQSFGSDLKLKGLTTGFDLLFGGTPARGLVIGGGLIGARTSDPSASQGAVDTTLGGSLLLIGATAFGQYYFDPTKGGHVQLLLGYAGIQFINANGRGASNSPGGLMFGIGGGYDFWVADQWSIGPFARLLYASMSASSGGATATDKYIYPSIGVAFTLH